MVRDIQIRFQTTNIKKKNTYVSVRVYDPEIPITSKVNQFGSFGFLNGPNNKSKEEERLCDINARKEASDAKWSADCRYIVTMD